MSITDRQTYIIWYRVDSQLLYDSSKKVAFKNLTFPISLETKRAHFYIFCCFEYEYYHSCLEPQKPEINEAPPAGEGDGHEEFLLWKPINK